MAKRKTPGKQLVPADWEVIEWIAARYGEKAPEADALKLHGTELLEWLAKWGDSGRLEIKPSKADLPVFENLDDLYRSTRWRGPSGPATKRERSSSCRSTSASKLAISAGRSSGPVRARTSGIE